MTSPPVNGNGHRRRELVKRVKTEETHCALCDGHVDQTLHYLEPMSAVVDEDIPRAHGGSPYQRSNCRLMHRSCNRWKGTLTLAQARAKWHSKPAARPAAPVESSPIW